MTRRRAEVGRRRTRCPTFRRRLKVSKRRTWRMPSLVRRKMRRGRERRPFRRKMNFD